MISEKQIQKVALFHGSEGEVSLDAIIDDENETFWASQIAMADLFGVTRQNISYHLNDIFNSSQLDKKSVVENIITTSPDGRKYNTNFYNLDAIISVGYRVNSNKAIEFRKWATKQLREMIVKGFLLNDDKLNNGSMYNDKYFDRLVEIFEEVKLSKRKFNQKITDIYATSFDYNKDAKITMDFFKTVQIDLLEAVCGQSLSERIDSDLIGSDNRFLVNDFIISNNYLSEDEMDCFDSIVDEFLKIAISRAKNQIPMSMKNWKGILDSYIALNHESNSLKKGIKPCDTNLNHNFYKNIIIFNQNFKKDFDKLLFKVKCL